MQVNETMKLPWIIALALLLGHTDANLAERWKIEGPRAEIEPDTSSSSAFQLEYTVSDKVRFARYKLFQTSCKEAFGQSEGDDATAILKAPVTGSGDVVGEGEKAYHTLKLSPDPSSSNDDHLLSHPSSSRTAVDLKKGYNN